MSVWVTCTFFLLSFTVSAQSEQSEQGKGKLEFLVTSHDFGKIKEDGGSVDYMFEFINSGDSPVEITNVKASCGCTVPGWSRKPIVSNEKGFVRIQYNPRNRPGSFKKILTVKSNAEKTITYLYITGNVLHQERVNRRTLRTKMGGIRIKSRSMNMGKMTAKEVISKSFLMLNDSENAISFTGKYDGPDFIKILIEPPILTPGQYGKINIEYDPVHNDNLGLNSHGISIYTDEEAFDVKKLNILATITEYFPSMSETKKKEAPKLIIANRYRDLGVVRMNSKTTAEFVLTNVGKTKLNIRKVASNCACLTTTLGSYNIKPGKTAVLKATFDSTKRRGSQNKAIIVYSNDFRNSAQAIAIKLSIK